VWRYNKQKNQKEKKKRFYTNKEGKMLLCDIWNDGWNVDCLSTLLTTIAAGIWKCPLCTPPAPSSQCPLRHLRFPSPILESDSDSKPLRAQKKNPVNCQHKKLLSKTTKKKLFLPNSTLKTYPLPSVTPCHLHRTPAPWTRSTFRPESGVRQLKHQV